MDLSTVNGMASARALGQTRFSIRMSPIICRHDSVPRIMASLLRTLLPLILLSTVLSACGQKGPLYLPSEDPSAKKEQR